MSGQTSATSDKSGAALGVGSEASRRRRLDKSFGLDQIRFKPNKDVCDDKDQGRSLHCVAAGSRAVERMFSGSFRLWSLDHGI